MSERGETDSRSIGISDKFRATAVRRNVVNHQTRRVMAQRRQLDMFTEGRIVGMLESSRSQTEVSLILNVDQSVISRLWQRFQRTGDVTRQPVSGRPRVTIPRQDRYLVINARRQRGSTAREHWVRRSQSPQEYANFGINCLQETQSCWPVYQKTSSLHSPHVCA
ncbi:transposable element Tc3 transposase [Trichonephila clavipes]|nr:transposable element Tc3 transposase [Trichonephila clavipes]